MSELGGPKRTTSPKMLPLCIVNASFSRSNSFSALEHCFLLPLRFIAFWKNPFVPGSFVLSSWFIKTL